MGIAEIQALQAKRTGMKVDAKDHVPVKAPVSLEWPFQINSIPIF